MNIKNRLVAVVAGLAVCVAIIPATVASATTVFNTTVSCGGSFPSHAQSIFGTQPHNHTIVLGMSTYASAGQFVTSTKTIWPTGVANRVWNGGTSSATHVGVNSGGSGAGSSVYCRNSSNA